MANSNLISYDDKIVMNETPVQLSDEKLKGMLLRAYERAQKDSNEHKFHDYYSILLSIAGTLFVSLISSSFGAVLCLTAETVTTIAWVVCIIAGLLGFVFLGIHVNNKLHSDTEKRDKAVEEIFSQYSGK